MAAGEGQLRGDVQRDTRPLLWLSAGDLVIPSGLLNDSCALSCGSPHLSVDWVSALPQP